MITPGGPRELSPAVSYCFFAGAPESTAATPAGLMLKARKINGSLPGFAIGRKPGAEAERN